MSEATNLGQIKGYTFPGPLLPSLPVRTSAAAGFFIFTRAPALVFSLPVFTRAPALVSLLPVCTRARALVSYQGSGSGFYHGSGSGLQFLFVPGLRLWFPTRAPALVFTRAPALVSSLPLSTRAPALVSTGSGFFTPCLAPRFPHFLSLPKLRLWSSHSLSTRPPALPGLRLVSSLPSLGSGSGLGSLWLSLPGLRLWFPHQLWFPDSLSLPGCDSGSSPCLYRSGFLIPSLSLLGLRLWCPHSLSLPGLRLWFPHFLSLLGLPLRFSHSVSFRAAALVSSLPVSTKPAAPVCTRAPVSFHSSFGFLTPCLYQGCGSGFLKLELQM